MATESYFHSESDQHIDLYIPPVTITYAIRFAPGASSHVKYPNFNNSNNAHHKPDWEPPSFISRTAGDKNSKRL